jgi:hypothetical protein
LFCYSAQFFVNLNDKKKEGTEVDTKKAGETGLEQAGGDAAAVDSNTQLQVNFQLNCPHTSAHQQPYGILCEFC